MKPRTVCAVSAATDLAILALGWIPARVMVSTWQRREGLDNLHGALLASRYEFLGVTLPMRVTALAIIGCSLITLVLLCRAARFRLVAAYTGFLIFLILLWGFAFVSISFDAFD